MPNRAPPFWILVACLLFATMSALVKIAAASISLPEIVFFRTVPAAVGLLALARLRGERIGSQHWKLHALRSFVGVSSMFVGFYAVSQLPLATATTLEYTTPLFMLVYIVVLARTHLTPQMAFAMLGGFAGVIMVLRPSIQTGHTLAFFAGLCSGALAAVAYALIRRLGRAGEPAWRIVLWYSLSGTLVAGLMVPLSAPSQYDAKTLIALASIGIVGLFAQLAMTRAFSSGPTTLLASLQYSTVAFAAGYGALIWGDTFSISGFLGLLLIILSGIVAVHRTARSLRVETRLLKSIE